MVWGACVAVYMSVNRMLNDGREDFRLEGVQTVFYGIWGVIAGTFLAAPLLMILRWKQGHTFPRSGGEIIWLFGALVAVEWLLFDLFYAAFEDGYAYLCYRGTRALFGIFLWLPAYIYAIRTCRGYWRAYFVILLPAGFIWYVNEHVVYADIAIFLFREVFSTSLLAVALWVDLRRVGPRLPWPHWIGIGVWFASNGLSTIAYVVRYLTESAP